MPRDFLIIEACDFQGYPGGGQTQQAMMLMKAFAEKVALVGITTDDSPVGRWLERKIEGRSYPYFSIGTHRKRFSRPPIPTRMVRFLELLRYRKLILALGIKRALIQSPELFMACSHWGWESLCYWFPGVNNPLASSRYRWGKAFRALFPKLFFRTLRNADVLLAGADDRSLRSLKESIGGLLDGISILKFPTRFDSDIFYPMDRVEARQGIHFAHTGPGIAMVGRISREKGWDFLLDAFRLFLSYQPDANMFFVGDGEDRKRLERRIKEYGLDKCVFVTGLIAQKGVAAYLNAVDLVVVGSLAEGWSTSMVEALACGCTIVSTDISGARDMILPGENGYIVEERSPQRFAAAMDRALRIADARRVSLKLSQHYSVRTMKRDLSMVWSAIADSDS